MIGPRYLTGCDARDQVCGSRAASADYERRSPRVEDEEGSVLQGALLPERGDGEIEMNAAA